MSEWWTYRPSDLLMFSPRIYWRLFESLNEAWWPAQVVLVGAGLAWIGWQVRLRRVAGGLGAAGSHRMEGAPGDAAARVAAVVLAACWLLVAGAFMVARFAPINWPATAFALVFVLQALGLLAPAADRGLRAEARAARRHAGLALGLWALLGHPLLAAADARPWQQAEVFGLAPDPTAIGTLAFLLALDSTGARRRRVLRVLWIVPLAWCAVSAATLGVMGSPQAWVMLVAALVALAAAQAR
jgi:hypothetical protein